MDTGKSIELLNQGVADELQAVHQYMYWHFHLADQGLHQFAALFKQIAITEMRHVETFAERILFLKGDVEMTAAGPVEKITSAEDILARAAAMEREAAEMYNRFAVECGQNADAASRQIFETLVNDEEGHFDLFDTQLENIKRYGPSYLALQAMDGPEKSGQS